MYLRARSASATSGSSASPARARARSCSISPWPTSLQGKEWRSSIRTAISPTDILDAIPRQRINDVCYLDAGETEYPVGFNPATRIAPERRALAASGIVAAFKHLWSDSWGPRLEHFLFHGVAALISREHATLIDLARLYTDDRFRERVVSHVTDPETLRFWQEEFPSYTKSLRSDAIAPVLNKVGQIAASPHLRLILGQVAPRLDLSFTMNNRRILIANLAKGTIGEQAANLLGSLLVSHLQLIAMERGALPPEERVPFFVAYRRIPDLQLGRIRILAIRGEKIRAALLSREPIHRSVIERGAQPR